MPRQTFESFMISAGVDPDEHREAFSAAQADGNPKIYQYLQRDPFEAGDPTYDTRHLDVFWDNVCQQYLVEVLVTWLGVTDSLGTPEEKALILRRRLGHSVHLAELVERIVGPRRGAALCDPRLDSALSSLRGPTGQEWMMGVTQLLTHAPMQIRQLIYGR